MTTKRARRKRTEIEIGNEAVTETGIKTGIGTGTESEGGIVKTEKEKRIMNGDEIVEGDEMKIIIVTKKVEEVLEKQAVEIQSRLKDQEVQNQLIKKRIKRRKKKMNMKKDD